jgi:hypothetical protein
MLSLGDRGWIQTTVDDESGKHVEYAGKHLVTWEKRGGHWKVTAESINLDSPRVQRDGPERTVKRHRKSSEFADGWSVTRAYSGSYTAKKIRDSSRPARGGCHCAREQPSFRQSAH